MPIFIILFKHRHVTPHWKEKYIKNIYFYAYFDLLGPKKRPKRGQNAIFGFGTENIWWGLTAAEGL